MLLLRHICHQELGADGATHGFGNHWEIDTISQSALRKVQEFFSSWRPTLTIDELTGIPTFSLDLKPNEGRESLKRSLEYMKQSGKRCYVAIDEFQQIMNYPEDGVEALIRSYIQFLPMYISYFRQPTAHDGRDVLVGESPILPEFSCHVTTMYRRVKISIICQSSFVITKTRSGCRHIHLYLLASRQRNLVCTSHPTWYLRTS